MVKCARGHEARVVSTRRDRETIEDIGYAKERIKHFDREGSEFWAEIDVPVIVERTHDIEVIEYVCDHCGDRRELRRTIEDAGAPRAPDQT
ncbi:MAG: hypothetical protein R3D27_09495 [Hyphomicrobiaceae bacterium]